MEEEKQETQKKDSDGFGFLLTFLLCLIPISIIILVTAGAFHNQDKQEAAVADSIALRAKQPILHNFDSIRAAHPNHETNPVAAKLVNKGIYDFNVKQVDKPFAGKGIPFYLDDVTSDGLATFYYYDHNDEAHLTVVCQLPTEEAEKLEHFWEYYITAGTCEVCFSPCLDREKDSPGYCLGLYKVKNAKVQLAK